MAAIFLLIGPYAGILLGGIAPYVLTRRKDGRLRPLLVIAALVGLTTAAALWGIWIHPEVKLLDANCPSLGLGFVLGAYAVLLVPPALVSGAAGTLAGWVREAGVAATWVVSAGALFALIDLQRGLLSCALGN